MMFFVATRASMRNPTAINILGRVSATKTLLSALRSIHNTTVVSEPASKSTSPKSPKKATKKEKIEKPPVVKLTKEDYPPKTPPSAWVLYVSRYFQGAGKPKSLPETQETVKKAATTWHAMTEAEKKGFKDESAQAREEYRKKYDAWIANIEPAKLKLLNDKLVSRGKRRHVRHHDGETLSRVPTTFARFMKERAAKTDFAGKKTTEWLKDLSAEWKALSDTEKKPYVDAYNKDKAEFEKSRAS